MVDYKGFRVPEWKNKGTEPIEEFRKAGWKISQKPPAEYFNWFFSSTYDSIKKLIDDQDAHSKLTNNPHKVTSEQVNTYNKPTIDDKVKKVNDDLNQSITNHASRTDNPHKVTATQTGAYTKSQTDTKISGAKETITQETDAKVSNLDSKLTKTINEHASRTDNPHKVTASQVGAYTKEQTDEAIKLNVPKIDTSVLVSKQDLENHKNDTYLHTSAEEKNKWNNHEKNKNIHVELKEKEKWNNHENDISKHVTEEDKNNWNNKFDSENEQYKKDQQALKDYISSEIEKQPSEWFGTLEEYEALETKDDKTIYYIHD